MSPAFARPLLHTVHLLAFVLLLGTGLLLFIPSLRAAVTGGYSLVIRETHQWGGVAFVVLPSLILGRCGVRRVFAAPAQYTLRTAWQGLHIGVTIVISLVFAVTGFVLWGKRQLPESAVDTSLVAHQWLTYAVMVLVAVHLVDVGVTALFTRLQAAAQAAAEDS